MKFSIVLSTQPASFSALAYKGDIEKNIDRIKELGYDGVELAVRNPKELNIDYIQKLTTKNNLPVPAIGTGQAYGEEGLSFTHPDPMIREKAIERIKEQVVFAKKLNALVIIGLIRGSVPKEGSAHEAEKLLIYALQECASVDPDVKLAIEPINRYETNLLNTVEESLKLLDKIIKPNVGLLLDTFHMNIEEPVIRKSILMAKEKIFHFHVADSNRCFAGAGHIDFKGVLNDLKDAGYNGYISAEIMPYPDSDIAAQKNIEHFKKIITK
ncbi:5-keto-L-gluconate epimerase [Bacteroidota bacterium]